MTEKVNEKNAEFDAPDTVKNLVYLDETFYHKIIVFFSINKKIYYN